MPEKANIWILNHYAEPVTGANGTRHHDFAEELVRRGYRVSVFAASFDQRTQQERLAPGEAYRKESINGIDWYWIRTFPYRRNDFRRMLNMLSFAARLSFYGLFIKNNRPDVIIGSSVHPFTCLAGYFLAQRKGARFLAEIRDLWPQVAVDMGILRETSAVTRILRLIERFIYKKAEKIIILLPAAGKYIESFGVDAGKIVYIPNGVNISRYDRLLGGGVSAAAGEIGDRYRNRFKILYLGAHGPTNGLATVVSAAKLLQDRGIDGVQLIFVGDGPDKPALMAAAERERLKNISFHDPVKKTEVPQLLRAMDACLFSFADIDVFKYGISPNKMFDYLCSGKPIIFSCRAPNDLVKLSDSGISVPPGNPDALAAAMLDLYRLGDDERARLGANGRAYVEKNHDIPILVDTLANILACSGKEHYEKSV